MAKRSTILGSKGVLAEQRRIAKENPLAELNHLIFEKYNLTKLSFIIDRRVYRFRENFIRGNNGEYSAYDGYILTVQQGINPNENTICHLQTEQELRAIYKIITKKSIDTLNKK